MPNWIHTTYVFSGDTQQITELQTALQKQQEEPYEEIALSDIVKYFGWDFNKIACHGYIAEYTQLTDSMLEISVITAYYPMHEVWNLVVKRFPKISYQFYGG